MGTRTFRPALLGHVPSPLTTGHADAAGPPQAAGAQRSESRMCRSGARPSRAAECYGGSVASSALPLPLSRVLCNRQLGLTIPGNKASLFPLWKVMIRVIG